MARNRRGYSRYYIILQEAHAGFRLKEQKAAAGYAKIELRDQKGRILIYAQDLRPLAQEQQRYIAIALNGDGDSVAVLGDFEVDANGNGQNSWTFDADDIGDTGYPLEEFDGVALAVCPNNAKRGSKAPFVLLGSFKKNKAIKLEDINAELLGIPLLDEDIEQQAQNANSQKVDVSASVSSEETLLADAPQMIEQAEEISPETQKIEERLMAEKEEENKLTADAVEIATEEKTVTNPALPMEKEVVQEVPPEPIEATEQDTEHWGIKEDNEAPLGQIGFAPFVGMESAAGYSAPTSAWQTPNVHYRVSNYQQPCIKFSDMIEGYLRAFIEKNAIMTPFSETIPNSKWCLVMVDPSYTMQWNWYRYDRYLIGLIYEGEQIKYVAYGVPGRFCMGEQPFQGTTGYIYWYPARGQKRQYGDFGYWVAYVDAKTGRIAYPF